MSKIKILYLITDLGIGGAQTALIQILNHLDKEQFSPTVACFYDGDGVLAADIRTLGVPVIDLGITAKWRLDGLWRLYRLLRKTRPFILHSSLFHANIPARLLGRLARIPIIITWRQNISIGGASREKINRWTASLDDQVTAVCKLAQKAEIDGTAVSPQKVSLIYNCVDPSLFTTGNTAKQAAIRHEFGIPANAPLIGTISRLHPQKGLRYLLDAMPHVRKQQPDIRLLIVGDGELRTELQEQAQLLNLSATVIFAGTRNDVTDILPILDLFILPSLWEGLPLAVLEAMAASLPIIATNVGGVPELVIDGKTGRLITSGNEIALSQAILQLLTHPKQAKKMGVAGQKRASTEFSATSITRQLEALYLRLITQKMNS